MIRVITAFDGVNRANRGVMVEFIRSSGQPCSSFLRVSPSGVLAGLLRAARCTDILQNCLPYTAGECPAHCAITRPLAWLRRCDQRIHEGRRRHLLRWFPSMGRPVHRRDGIRRKDASLHSQQQQLDSKDCSRLRDHFRSHVIVHRGFAILPGSTGSHWWSSEVLRSTLPVPILRDILVNASVRWRSPAQSYSR